MDNLFNLHLISRLTDLHLNSSQLVTILVDQADINSLDNYLLLLTSEERKRLNLLKQPEKIKEFVSSHAFRNMLISYFGNLPFEQMAFKFTETHKAYLSPNPDQIEFNLSHSGSMILLGFSQKLAVGVDIEQINPLTDADSVSKLCFHQNEIQQIVNANGSKIKMFYNFWTRKEAYLKAIGTGIFDQLTSIDTSFPSIQDDQKNIQIKSYIWNDYAIALAGESNLNEILFFRVVNPDEMIANFLYN